MGVLLVVWLIILVAIWRLGLNRLYGAFLLFGVIPILLALGLVWGVAASQPPMVPLEGAHWPGISYALLIAGRIAVMGGLLQLAFVPIMNTNELAALLRNWGFGSTAIHIAVSSIALLDEVKRMSIQVIEARMARGLQPKGRLRNVLSMPSLLRPIFFATLLNAGKRADLWHHRGIDPHAVALHTTRETHRSWLPPDTYTILAAFAFLAAGIWSRWAIV